MKALLIAFAGVLGVAVFSVPAHAQYHHGHSSSRYGHSSSRYDQSRYHDDLGHRAYHRELTHREVHRRPLAPRQHDRLHDNLDHDAYHDELEHRAVHPQHSYSVSPHYGYPTYGGHAPSSHSYYRSSGNGFYLSRPGFSLRIGH